MSDLFKERARSESGKIQSDNEMIDCFSHYVIPRTCGHPAGSGQANSITRPASHITTKDD